MPQTKNQYLSKVWNLLLFGILLFLSTVLGPERSWGDSAEEGAQVIISEPGTSVEVRSGGRTTVLRAPAGTFFAEEFQLVGQPPHLWLTVLKGDRARGWSFESIVRVDLDNPVALITALNVKSLAAANPGHRVSVSVLHDVSSDNQLLLVTASKTTVINRGQGEEIFYFPALIPLDSLRVIPLKADILDGQAVRNNPGLNAVPKDSTDERSSDSAGSGGGE